MEYLGDTHASSILIPSNQPAIFRRGQEGLMILPGCGANVFLQQQLKQCFSP